MEGPVADAHLEKGHRSAWLGEELLQLYPQTPDQQYSAWVSLRGPSQASIALVPMHIHILRLPRMP